MTERYSGKDIYRCCFVKHLTEPKIHVCNCCKDTVKADVAKDGYEGCKVHLKLDHEHDWKGWVKSYKQGGKGPIDIFGTPSDKAKHIYEWIEWIVEDNHPFSFVERINTRTKSKLKEISKRTVKKYMNLLFCAVKDVIRKRLPSTFGLVIDDLRIDSDHYNGIFATFTDASSNEVEEFLLSCNVGEYVGENTEFDENLPDSVKHLGFTATDLFDVIVDSLAQFGVNVDVDNFHTTIEFITGDNSSTNQKLARDTSIMNILLSYE